MSNILWHEIKWTYRWLRTFIPWRFLWKTPVLTGIIRRGSRKRMQDNRVLASLWAWLRGR